MRNVSPDEPLRVLLLTRTMHPGDAPVWRKALAPWALGAFCLRSYVESIPDLAARVRIDIRSYPSDASDTLILDEIRQHRPDVVGFTSQPWNYVANVRISRTVARLWPDLVVLHGGPMVISRGAYLAKCGPSIHVAVEGEGEETFAELLRHYAFGDRPLAGIAGIAFFDADAKVRVNPPRDPPDLSTLPPVMTPSNLAQMGTHILYETARGCPFRCSFCNWGSQRTKLRARSRAAIEHDLRAILAAPGVEHIWLTDSGLDISVDHVTFVADTIHRHRTTQVGVCGYAFLLHMDLSYVGRIVHGIDQLMIGLQTANEDSLSELGRKALSVQRFDRILDAVLPHYPALRVDLLFGLPHIGPDDLRDSVRFLLRKGIWLFNLFRLVAIPGTELAENKQKYGLSADEEYPFSVYASDGCTSEDMFEMQQFKVNMDAVRFLVAHGGYPRALAAGVDLVDFASQLHKLIPNFNRLIPYDAGFDWAPSAELVASMLAAVDRYTDRDEGRAVLKDLIRSRLSGLALEGAAPGDATPRFQAAHGGSRRAESGGEGSARGIDPGASGEPAGPGARDARPPGRQSAGGQSHETPVNEDQIALTVREGGRSWTLRVEPVAPGRQYFRVVGRCGLYYESEGGEGDRRAGAVLSALVQRMLKTTPAGASADRPEDIVARLQSIRVPGLEIVRRGPAGAAQTPHAPATDPSPAHGGSRPRRLPIQTAGESGGGAPRGS